MKLNNRKITIILLVFLFIGLAILYVVTQPNKVDAFYKSLSEVLVVESKAAPITKKIQELLKEENDLYYVIISIGREKRNIMDSIDEVKVTINETTKLFMQLSQNTIEVRKGIQLLESFSQEIKDKNEQEIANKIIVLLKNRCSMLDRMHTSYDLLSKEEQNLYRILGGVEVNFYEVDQILDEIEAKRKNFNYYAKKYDTFGKEMSAILK